MNRPQPVSRRTLLTAGGVVAAGIGTIALAGCSQQSAPPGGQPAEPPNGGGSGQTGTTIAPLASIPVGGTLAATLNGKPIVLAQPAAGTVVAFSAICTHQGCVVNATPTEFDCPCHGSRFAAATGKVLQGPAQLPLPQIAVTVSGNNVVTA